MTLWKRRHRQLGARGPAGKLDAELLGVLGVQALPPAELHGLGTDHASDFQRGPTGASNRSITSKQMRAAPRHFIEMNRRSMLCHSREAAPGRRLPRGLPAPSRRISCPPQLPPRAAGASALALHLALGDEQRRLLCPDVVVSFWPRAGMGPEGLRSGSKGVSTLRSMPGLGERRVHSTSLGGVGEIADENEGPLPHHLFEPWRQLRHPARTRHGCGCSLSLLSFLH